MATVEAQVERMAADAGDEYRSMIFAMVEGEEFDDSIVREKLANLHQVMIVQN